MNLMINYDVINAINDTRDGFTPYKIIRNNKTRWIKLCFPTMLALDSLFFKEGSFKSFPLQIIEFLIFTFCLELFGYKYFGDIYKDESEQKLKLLVILLKKLNIDTSYDLLKESSCYHKIHNLKLNDKKIPQLLESKYILIPSYDLNGDVVDTSVLQEHVIGSSKYVLSIGSPQKVLKPAFSHI